MFPELEEHIKLQKGYRMTGIWQSHTMAKWTSKRSQKTRMHLYVVMLM
jgi:hypothetical protein